MDAADTFQIETGIRVEVIFLENLMDLKNSAANPDILLGDGLYHFPRSEARDFRRVLDNAGRTPEDFLKGIYSSEDGWGQEVKILPLALDYPLLLSEGEDDTGKYFPLDDLIDGEPLGNARRGRMEFSPWWNSDLAWSFFLQTGGYDWKTLPSLGNSSLVQTEVETWRTWSKDRNSSQDLVFRQGLLSLVPLREIKDGRIGFWSLGAKNFSLIAEEEKTGITVRIPTYNNAVPILPNTQWAVIPYSGTNAGEVFLTWLLSGDNLKEAVSNSNSQGFSSRLPVLVSQEWMEVLFFLPGEPIQKVDFSRLFSGDMNWDQIIQKFMLTE